jgi:hypothetical protein
MIEKGTTMITSPAARRWPRMRRNHGLGRRAALLRVLAAFSGAGIALTLAAGPAGAQTAASPPQPGATLAAIPGGAISPLLFYTGTDRQAWEVDLSNMSQHVPQPLGGRLIGGPAAVFVTPGAASSTLMMPVFGRGTDNQLWWLNQTATSRWAALGGRLTSKPNAVTGHIAGLVQVFARGTDGAVWYRDGHVAPGGGVVWNRWASLGGRLLAGTAPVAVYSGRYGLVVAAVGIDRAVWVNYTSPDGRRSWHSASGRTSSDTGLVATAAGTVVAFARGLDNAGYYKEVLGRTPGVTAGWHSLHGTLTSGLTAVARPEWPQATVVSVYTLGSGSRPYADSGTWPSFTGWASVRLG